MFGDKERQEIAVFIEKEAAVYLTLRSSLFGLQKEIFSDLIIRRNEQLTELESALEQFALVQIELSESMFNNAYNAQLVAAVGILAWQQQLLTKALQFCYTDKAFEQWTHKTLPPSADITALLSEAYRQQMSAGIRSLTARERKLEPFTQNMAEELLGLHPQRLDMLYDLSASETIDQTITDFIKQLFSIDARICFEMTALTLHLLMYAGAGADEHSGAMIALLETVENAVHDLVKDQTKPN